ncbi:MAG: hypothetical protein K8U57_14025 [Planctomycetes bacterium]|nr:hypothetical protein [Planctomycetota bacterium]
MFRTSIVCCALAGIVGLSIGCNPNSSTTKPASAPAPDSAAAKKEEAIKAMKVKLDEMDKKATELKEKAEKATGEEKVKLEAKWKETAPKREAAVKKLEELKAATAEKWEAVKTEAEHSFNEFKKAIE